MVDSPTMADACPSKGPGSCASEPRLRHQGVISKDWSPTEIVMGKIVGARAVERARHANGARRRNAERECVSGVRGRSPRTNTWCGRGDSNPHEIAPASPSSWCVCQFRHFRMRCARAPHEWRPVRLASLKVYGRHPSRANACRARVVGSAHYPRPGGAQGRSAGWPAAGDAGASPTGTGDGARRCASRPLSRACTRNSNQPYAVPRTMAATINCVQICQYE